ncbi:hypothetical protein QAD02_003990 [Eretmocerus hayati]|uniref:Uncharacterized protein n=1 Tax=Eretmocerus hayati TaxID=131215 RepID=A0ACC2NN87_9HYME|nr:hypothetical protein QAD02_003990 [Eretmocerus hayati]
MDDEKQKDELIALESIYNDEEFTYCKQNDNYHVTLKIYLSLPEKFFFTYKDSRHNDEKSEKVFISHLPPITLLMLLPIDYPSIHPPRYTIRSPFLSPALMTKLCKKLDQLYKSNPGQEIIFTWMNFLQSETLEYLNILEGINIDHVYTLYRIASEKSQKNQELASCAGAQGTCQTELRGSASNPTDVSSQKRRSMSVKKAKKSRSRRFYDERAVIDILVGRNPVQMLIDYNEMRNQIEFRRNFYSCKVCFADKLGENCVQFLPCNHVFCKECTNSYFETKIQEGAVQNIFCPEEGCKSEATPDQIKNLVSPELFLKYDSILLNATLDTMNDIIYCPRKSCQYPVSHEPEENMANCPVCSYAFCIYCKAVYHGIEPCKVNTAEKQNLIKEYQEATGLKKTQLEMRYGKKNLQNFIDNAMSENWIEKHSQNCPRCCAAIEKSDGCNKMTCWKCNTFFCWTCSAKLNRQAPYEHYRDPSSRCFNKLYQGDEEFFDDDVVFILNY